MSANTNTNPTSTTTASGTQPSRGGSIGAGLGSAVKGAFETVQGIGNSVRGNALDFVDSAAGTTRPGQASGASDGTGAAHPATDLGRRQAEHGVQRMEAAKQGTAADTAAGAPMTAAAGAHAPLPPRALNGSLGGTGQGTVGNDGMGGQVRSSV